MIEDNYFTYLCDQVNEEDEYRAGWLNMIPYEYHFVLDKNRAAAGLTLRARYSEDFGVILEDVQDGPASVLEVLVGIALEFARNADISEDTAYHEMLRNIGIGKDHATKDEIESKIYRWMSGECDIYGHGSPFPLEHYNGNVMNLDLWTAMTLYINENYPIEEGWINA